MRATLPISIIAALLVMAPSPSRAATPINACGTVIKTPGSYVLAKNLTLNKASTSPCILVKADFVTLDLGGFTIDCNNVIATVDAISTIGNGALVRNGIITGGCPRGVGSSTGGVLIEGLTVVNAVYGIFLGGGVGDSVFRSVSIDSFGQGISFNCPASVIEDTALGSSGKDLDQLAGDGCNFFNTLHSTGP